jgi:hypothetical protein
MIKQMWQYLEAKYGWNEEGATAVEYGLMVAHRRRHHRRRHLPRYQPVGHLLGGRLGDRDAGN